MPTKPTGRPRGRPRKQPILPPEPPKQHESGLPADLVALLSDPKLKSALRHEVKRKLSYRRLEQFRPYPVQKAFYDATLTNSVVLMLAANRVGKSFSAAAMVAMHLTGLYPDWWEGKRFDEPVRAWACGLTAEVTRDIQQHELIGPPSRQAEWGTGLIPKDCIGESSMLRGTANAIDTVSIKHSSGGWSTLSFKAFSQGRERFQGTAQHVVWLDEEAPIEVFSECVMRTTTTRGSTVLTFTPLNGYSELVTLFLGPKPPGAIIRATLDDALHFSEEERKEMIERMLPHEREARSRGEPALGSGAIFPFTEEAIAVDPFLIPQHYRCIGGIDFGWNHPSAAVKLAYDPDSDTVFVTHAYREREKTPTIHAATLRGWGKWLPWAWPHDGLQTEKGSGITLADQYRDQGLNMLPDRATDAQGTSFVEPTIQEMYQRMEEGRLKVFNTLPLWFEEMRRYHRKDGRVVKVADDLMAATRYALMMLRFSETPNQWGGGPLIRPYTRLV